MSVDVKLPSLGESISEGTVSVWHVQVGQRVEMDQPLCEVETDKVTTDIPSPVTGTVSALLVAEGGDVAVGGPLVRIDETPAEEATPGPENDGPPAPAGEGAQEPAVPPPPPSLTPSARRLAHEAGLDPASLTGTGRGGRVGGADVRQHLLERTASPAAEARVPLASPQPAAERPAAPPAAPTPAGPRAVHRVALTRMRRRIAERLKEVQNTAAMLTTFNEVDMSAATALRETHGAAFQQRHGVRLGWMGFFVTAVVRALRDHPALNSRIEGLELVTPDSCDIGVAVSTEGGLVVPVVRDAQALEIAGIEREIGRLAGAARDGSLKLEDLQGGTFTVTNGGVFGSLLSTPILNGPQSGILGMHTITRRPVAVGDRVEVRPVMFLALSYDHRVVDGSEAVRFLVGVKQRVEDPTRLLLGL